MNRHPTINRAAALPVVFLSALFFALCASRLFAGEHRETTTVYILTNGDIHEHSAYLPRIAAYIKGMKKAHANVLAFDCGDALTDYAEGDRKNGDLRALGTSGNAMHRAMARMGYDACTVGNHDECYGMAQLAALMTRWKLRFMGANLAKSPVSLPFVSPPVLRLDGVAVGVVGTISTHRWHLDEELKREGASPGAYAFAPVRDARVAQAVNGTRAAGAEIVVLLTHQEDGDDRESADNRGLSGVSVIAGGHSHSTLYENTSHHGGGASWRTSIAKSGFKGQYVSQLELVWDRQAKRIVGAKRSLVDMVTQASEDAEVKALIRAPLVKANDYDGDGASDLAVYDRATGTMNALPAAGAGGASWTLPAGADCVPVRGDFDGDGKADPAVYDRAKGVWTVLLSGSGYAAETRALGSGGGAPMAADYDGDLVTDLAVYDAARGELTAVLSSEGGLFVSVPLGGPGYAPAQGYFDEDALADPIVYRESDGSWAGLLSADDYAPAAARLGGGGRAPAPGYYDSEKRADLAVYDETSGEWSAMLSGAEYARVAARLGGPGWTAVTGDWDGDGREDPAVYREEDGTWALLLSGNSYAERRITFGGRGSIPVR